MVRYVFPENMSAECVNLLVTKMQIWVKKNISLRFAEKLARVKMVNVGVVVIRADGLGFNKC